MIVTFNMPTVSSYTLSAGTLISPSYVALTDRQPSIATKFQMGAVAGTPLSLTANLLTPIPVSWPFMLIGMSNCSLPAGTAITVNSNNGWNYTATGVLGVNNVNVNSFFAVIPQLNTQGSSAATNFRIQIATTGITNVQFTLGEIWCAGGVDLPLTRYSDRLVDPSWINRGALNAAWPVMRAPFRRFQGDLKPTWYTDAFANASAWPINLQRIMYEIATNRCVGIVPRWRQRGALLVPDANWVAATARLARTPQDGIGEIMGEASSDYFNSQLTLEELL